MSKTILALGAVLSCLTVILGAFGAHGLKKLVPADSVATFQTGVQYQMFHSIAILIAGLLSVQFSNSFLNTSVALFLLGILLFSGSLYLITAFHAMHKSVPTPVVIITPLGGLCFILGWIFLLMAILRN